MFFMSFFFSSFLSFSFFSSSSACIFHAWFFTAHFGCGCALRVSSFCFVRSPRVRSASSAPLAASCAPLAAFGAPLAALCSPPLQAAFGAPLAAFGGDGDSELLRGEKIGGEGDLRGEQRAKTGAWGNTRRHLGIWHNKRAQKNSLSRKPTAAYINVSRLSKPILAVRMN